MAGRRGGTARAAVAVLLAVVGAGLLALGLRAQVSDPPALLGGQTPTPAGAPSASVVPEAAATVLSRRVGASATGGRPVGRPGTRRGGGHPSPAPTRAAVGPDLPAADPVRIRIPSIGAASSLVRLGLNRDNTMATPADPATAGWFEQSPRPGTVGPAVIAGHVTWNRRPGVFFRLGALRPGQRIEVERADRRTAVFEVTRVRQYDKNVFPTFEVYRNIDHAGLRLITCAGRYDRARHRYLDNIVVYARLVGSRRA